MVSDGKGFKRVRKVWLLAATPFSWVWDPMPESGVWKQHEPKAQGRPQEYPSDMLL